MSDVREMTDFRDLSFVELAGVEGGAFVGDGYCGRPGPWTPVPHPLPSPVLYTRSIIAILVG
jgi:hypothetical protein